MNIRQLIPVVLSACVLLYSQPLAAARHNSDYKIDMSRGCGCDKPPQGPPGPQGPTGPQGPQGPQGPVGPAGTNSMIAVQALSGQSAAELEAIKDGTDPMVFNGTGTVVPSNLSINQDGEIILNSTSGAGDYVLQVCVNLQTAAGSSESVTGLSYKVEVMNLNGTETILSSVPLPDFSAAGGAFNATNTVLCSPSMFTIDAGDIVGTTKLLITLMGLEGLSSNTILNAGDPYNISLSKVN